jgi:hypothetical protein
MTVTVADVEDLAAKGWRSLDDTKKQALLDDAQTERQELYSGRNSRLPTLQGDEDIFVKNLAAHKFELAEGGEPQSENQTAGSTSYNTSQAEDYLTLTRFGETALRHLRDEQSTGIVRTY